MRSAAVIFACLAVALPLASCTIDFSVWPWTLSTAAGSTTAGSSLAITGLTVGQATLAGFGGLLVAVKAGALLGLAARQLTGRRGKRSVVTEAELGEQFVFDSILAMDSADCGKRYLCEIAATPVNQLTQEELTSLLLFQTGSGIASQGKATFNEAVRLGAFSRNAKTCATRYQRCSASSHETLTNNV